MNHVYRIVFNRALGLVQVASELAAGRASGGRGAACPRRPPLRTALALALASGMTCGGALAQVAVDQLPTGHTVIAGATVDQLAEVMQITQTEDRALIQWETFDIGAEALVEFIQGADQIALNRILDANPSQIMGDLTAGGTIFLINPNGIVFGAGSTVSVGSLVASTLAPNDANAFVELAGGDYAYSQFQWNAGASGALVLNEGAITTSGGQVVLLGAGVGNAGTITVGTGEATLVAAGSAQIQLVPGDLLAVVPMGPPVGAATIDNTGAISALGGTIVLHGQYADGLASSAVNSSGSLVATGIGGNPDGSITVASSGSVAAGGIIDAGAGDVAITARDDIALDANLVAGNLQITSDDGGVEQDLGTLEVSGNTTVHAAGDIALDSLNDFGGAVSLTGDAVSINDENALTLGTLAVGSLTAVSDGVLNLGAGVITGALSANSGGGAIIQSGPLEVGGSSSLTAGGDITLGSTNNFFEGAVSLDGAAVSILNNTTLFLGAVDVDSLVADASTIVLQDDVTSSGSQAYSAAVVLGDDVDLEAGGNVSFDSTLDGAQQLSIVADGHVGIDGAVDVAALSIDAGSFAAGAGMVTSGNLSLSVQAGGIGQLGAFEVGGESSFDAGTGNIVLTHANNSFAGAVALAGGTVSINDVGALALGTLATGALSVTSHGTLGLGSGTVFGNLQVDSGGGAVGQSGALTVAGTSQIDAGGASITLTDENNDFGGQVGLQAGAVAIRDRNALQLGGLDVGSLTVESGGALNLGTGSIVGALDADSQSGAITQSGPLEVGGTTSLTAGGNITLANVDNRFDGLVTLDGGATSIVSETLQLGAVDVDSLVAEADIIVLADDVASTGSQTYDGAVVLGNDVALTAGDGVGFASTVDGTQQLSIAAGGHVGIAGAVEVDGLSVDAASFAAGSTVTTTGDLSVAVDAGGIGQSGAFLVGGQSSFDAGTGDIMLLDVGNDFSGVVDLAGRAGYIVDGNALTLGQLDLDMLAVNSQGALDLGSGTITGLLDANSNGGAISQSGALTVGGTSQLDAGAGNITLTHAGNDFVGAVSLAGGAVSIADSDSLALGTLGVGSLAANSQGALDLGSGNVSGPLTASSQGAITQSAALSVGGTSTLDAGAGAITLMQATNDFVGQVLLIGGNIAIRDRNQIELGPVQAGDLSVTAPIIGLWQDIDSTGNQSYAGAVQLRNDVALDAGGDVTFVGLVNGPRSLSVDAGGHVGFGSIVLVNSLAVDADSVDVSALLIVPGDLTMAVQTGGIGQADDFLVGGQASFDAGTGAIVLTHGGNDFGGEVSLSGGTVAIRNVDALRLGALDTGSLSVTNTGSLDLGSGTVDGDLVADSNGGAIHQSGALAVTGNSTLDAGSGGIVLANAGNDFGGTVALTAGGATIADANALALGMLDVGSLIANSTGELGLGQGTIAGQLEANSNGGDIVQGGPLAVGGNALLDAGTGAITLGNAGNDFAATVTLTGGAVSIADANGLSLGTLDVGSLSAVAGGALQLAGGTVSGPLSLDSGGGSITQTGSLAVGGSSAIDAGAGAIVLGNIGNDFTGALSLTGASATIRDANALTLGTLDVGALDAGSQGALDLGQGMVAGNLVANSGGGAITQTGALSIGGSSVIDAGAGNISLDDGGNDFGGTVTLTGSAVEIADAGALTLGALDVASLDASSHGALDLGQGSIAGDLVAGSDGGDIGQSGPLEVGGTSAIDAGAGAIALTHVDNDFIGAVSLTGDAVAIVDRNQLRLGQVDANSLSITAATIALEQDITTTGDQTYSTAVLLDGDVTLDSGGNVQFGSTVGGAHALSVTADGHVGFADAVAVGALTVDSDSIGLASFLAVTGDLSLAVRTGGISQSQSFVVGGQSNLDAGGGGIVLAHAGNEFGGEVSLTAGAAQINAMGALALGTLDVGNLAVSSHGVLDLGQGTIGGTLDASSNGGAIGQSGALRVDGFSTLDAGTGAIALTDAGNDFANPVSLTGGAVSINDMNALMLDTLDVASLDVVSHGDLELRGGTVAGNLSADSNNGMIGQTGALRVGGTSSVDAGTGAVVLHVADNDFGGAVSLRGATAVVNDANALALGTLEVGDLMATSRGALDLGQGTVAGFLSANSNGGAISQSGALLVDGMAVVNADGGAITLADAGNDFRGTVLLAGDAVVINDMNALALQAFELGSLSATSHGVLDLGGTVAGTLVADSNGGAIGQSGALDVGGGSTLDAGAGAITLDHADNDFGGTVSLAGGAVSINAVGALTLGMLDVGALSARSEGPLGLGSGTVDDALVAHSGAGGIGQSGALSVGGTSTIDAGTGAIALTHAGNDFGGTVSLAGGAAAINDAGALSLGALDVGPLSATSHGALDLGTGSIAGALVADSDGGDIGQNGALSVGGTSTIDAGTGAIALTHADNDFVGAVSLGGGAVSIRDRNTLVLGGIDATSLQATAAAIVLRQGVATSGDQAYDGTVALDDDVALASGGDVSFGSDVGGAHTLSLDVDGHVGFGGAVAVGALSVDAGSASLASTLDVSGNLSLAVQAGGIVQAGAFRVGGTSDFDAGTGAVALTHAGNDFGGAVGLTGASLAVRDRNDLTLSHLRAVAGSDVHVTAGGALTLPLEAIDAGSGDLHLAADGGALTVRSRLAGGDVNLSGAGGIALGNDVDAAGTLHLQSGAGISQTGGRIEAALLTGSAGGEAVLTGANRIDGLGAFSASGIRLANAGPLTVTGPVDARAGSLLLSLSQGDLAIAGRVSAADIRLEVAGGIAQGDGGQLVGGTLSGRAGGAVALGGADRFVDNRVERIGDFTAHGGFSMTNGRSLTLVSLNGSDFTIDAGSADVYLSVDGDLRQDGIEWMYNGSGTWSATGGIGLPASPIYVMGLEAQTVAALGVPPAYFYAVRPDGSLLPIVGEAVNIPTSVWAGRAQTSSSRQVAYVDVGADASNYRGYGLVEPGVRLPDDQQPECDPDFPGPECEAIQ